MSGGAGGRNGLAVTIADVAALAGVTKMTVSRALRHPDKVRAETRDRIQAVIAETGYIPNRAAGSLTAGSSASVGLIVPTLRHSLFADTIEGVAEVLAEGGLDLIVTSSRYRSDVEETQIRALLERRPAAIVLTGLTHTAGARALLRSTRLAIVETWESAEQPIDMAVGYSNRGAARAMTEALIAAGYRRIAFVNGPSEANERARHRAEGYAGAMAAAGLPTLPIAVVHDTGVIALETGAIVLQQLLAATPDLDAIFFTSDVYAVGALLETRRLGLSVPERLGIAGFHDLDLGRVVEPALTTVHVPAQEIGREAGRMILARLAGQGPADQRRDLPFRIILRGSTRPPHD